MENYEKIELKKIYITGINIDYHLQEISEPILSV